MIEVEQEARKRVERALIVGTVHNSEDPGRVHMHLDELSELLKNLDIETVGRSVVKLKGAPHAQFYVGTGKADEIAALLEELEADVLVFDMEITPTQQRNWSKLCRKVCVIDRQEVILDIFADRANTREAVLQVELARWRYQLPRLAGAWSHFSRQRGGAVNAKGEGESQIELDRRQIKMRISRLEQELSAVRKQRATGRKLRERHDIPHGAIVGYTNAGKSSLLKLLSGREVMAEDKLFATLDPMTRKVQLPDNQTVLLTDTVGFVRKLPHDLVEAFKSTLEEAVLADFLILVLDLSSPEIDEHWDTTLSVLKELGADTDKILVVFNKVDRPHDELARIRARSLFANGCFISAATGEGVDELLNAMSSIAGEHSQVMELEIPPARGDMVALAHQKTTVLNSKYDDSGNALMTISANAFYREKFKDFLRK